MKKPAIPVDLEMVRREYFLVASDYYAAGRFLYWDTSVISICGNLLHHALEFYLKGHLWLTVSREELENLRHNLPRIWDRFKTTLADVRLDSFDQTIRDIDRFELIRYPEEIVEKGMHFHFPVTRRELNRSSHHQYNLPRYQFALEEVDGLVALLFEVCGLDPRDFLRGHFQMSADRERYLSRQNVAWSRMMEGNDGV